MPTKKPFAHPFRSQKIVVAVLLFALCFSPSPIFIRDVFAQQRTPKIARMTKSPATAAAHVPLRASHGMVASTSLIASQVGTEILKRGGNAVDAAIAVAFALAVVYPAAGNLGGGGFMMIRFRDGRTTAIDYREMAPAKAVRDVFLDANGELIRGEGSSTRGYRAAGVPGTVAGMDYALKKYGSRKISWSQLIEPARRLAAAGFPVSRSLARGLANHNEAFNSYEDSRKIFLRDGNYYKAGETIIQSDLAATFARLQRDGAREFYEGRTARLLAADMERNKGLMTLDDLHNYAVKERAPLHGSYRGYEIISMPPPSSGGAVLLEMLNILEGYDLRSMGADSAEHDHLMTEAMRRAFADRAAYFGDADFVKVPVAGLIDKDYAARQRSTINLTRASTSAEIKAGEPLGYESTETTHFTVVDRDGNAVSNTYTLNDSYGAKVIARGTGILLNNEMDDFTAKAGAPNSYGLIQSERNAVAPHKRPLSAMTPSFVLRKNGQLWFTIGSPGGPTIINTVLQVITNVIDYDMNIQQAIDAPRIHHQWLPDEIVYEPGGLSPATIEKLQKYGHHLTTNPSYMGDAQGIMVDEKPGALYGASDRRNDGAPAGY